MTNSFATQIMHGTPPARDGDAAEGAMTVLLADPRIKLKAVWGGLFAINNKCEQNASTKSLVKQADS